MWDEYLNHRVLTQERQSVWTARRTYTDGTHKVRATVHHDPYEFQAHAYVEVFNPRDLKWNRVHEMPTELWYEQLNVLYIDRFTMEQLDALDHTCQALVVVAADLLQGINA